MCHSCHLLLPAKPYKSQAELYNALTSRTINVMENVLAGVAFDDSNPFSEMIEVRISAFEVKVLNIVFCNLK